MEKKMAEGRKGATGFTRGGKFNRARAAMIALIAVLSFVVSVSVLSCENSTTNETENQVDWHFIPEGKWADTYGGSYTITSTELDYDSGFGDSFESTIIAATDATETSGVLIVQLTEVTNSTGDYPTNYTVDKYVGVYYRNYTNSHVFLVNAIDPKTFALVQKDSLSDAKSTFTVDNGGTYVLSWGSGYSESTQ